MKISSFMQRFLKQSNSLDKVRKEDETESNKIPASQLRQMRAALLEQSETIFEAQNLVKSIQSELDAFQLSRIEQLAIRWEINISLSVKFLSYRNHVLMYLREVGNSQLDSRHLWLGAWEQMYDFMPKFKGNCSHTLLALHLCTIFHLTR